MAANNSTLKGKRKFNDIENSSAYTLTTQDNYMDYKKVKCNSDEAYPHYMR